MSMTKFQVARNTLLIVCVLGVAGAAAYHFFGRHDPSSDPQTVSTAKNIPAPVPESKGRGIDLALWAQKREAILKNPDQMSVRDVALYRAALGAKYKTLNPPEMSAQDFSDWLIVENRLDLPYQIEAEVRVSAAVGEDGTANPAALEAYRAKRRAAIGALMKRIDALYGDNPSEETKKLRQADYLFANYAVRANMYNFYGYTPIDGFPKGKRQEMCMESIENYQTYLLQIEGYVVARIKARSDQSSK